MYHITRPEDQSTPIRPHPQAGISLTSLAGQLNDEAEWETIKANTYARMIANGQLDPDTCAEVDKPFEVWLDSLPDDCHSDPMSQTYSDAADFPIDDDDVPFEDSKPYFHRELPNGSIERLYSRLHLKSECAPTSPNAMQV